jgi:hypothetical protein
MRSFFLVAIAIIAATIATGVATGGPPPTLLSAAGLTVLLGAGHSYLGERALIGPLLRMDGLPRILGDVGHTRTILRFAWHLTSLLWWGLAAILAYMHFVPAATSRPFLWMIVVVFAISGAVVLPATRGAHKSWVYFFAIAAMAGYAAVMG